MSTSNKWDQVHSAAAVLFVALFALVLIAAREAVPSANAAEHPDTQFVFNAAAGGMSEVKLGTLAARKGTDPSVKQFGQWMVTDHSKAGDELKSLAIQSKITLPADVSKSDAEAFGKLSKLSGAEFDKAYANEMVKDHEKDVAEFQKEATRGNDPSLREFASKTLPTLQSHLQQAREIQRTVRASSGN
jgi:putative membrane protein